MGYRRRGVSKLDYAGYLAGALAYLVGQQGDAAGLLLFDESARSFLPPLDPAGTNPRGLPPVGSGPACGPHRCGARSWHLGELIDKRRSHHCHV